MAPQASSTSRIAALLLGIAPLVQQKILKPLQRESDLPPLPLQSLYILQDVGPLPMTELATRLVVSKQNLTPIANRLLALGYVERRPGEIDRRQVHLALTPAGETVLAEQHARAVNLITERLGALPTADAAELRQALDTVYRMLEKL